MHVSLDSRFAVPNITPGKPTFTESNVYSKQDHDDLERTEPLKMLLHISRRLQWRFGWCLKTVTKKGGGMSTQRADDSGNGW